MLRDRIMSLVLIGILSLSILSVAGLSINSGLRQAAAVGETITASKTTFFGSNVVEITVSDDTLEDNNDAAEEDEITVTFDVSSGGDHQVTDVTVGDDAGDVSAEIGDSGRFVFYVTADDDIVIGDLNDPEFDAESQLVFIGEGGDVDIGVDTQNDAFDGADDGISLNEEATVQIIYRDTSISLTYKNQKAIVTLDRSSVGSDGVFYLTIEDQDANNDPTGRDDLNFDGATDALQMNYSGVADNDLGQAIFDSGVDFSETSDNSGKYEARLDVNDILDIDAADTPKSVVVKLQDFDAYPNDPFYDVAAGVEGTDDVSRSLLVDNNDGLLQEVTNPATPKSELTVKVSDPDRNLDSKVRDRIIDAIAADLSSGNEDEQLVNTPIDLVETGNNTGLFVPDTPNNIIEVTIAPSVDSDGIVQIDSTSAAKSDIFVRYGDITPDDIDDATIDLGGGILAKEIQFKGKVAANTPPALSLGQTRIGAQDKVYLVLNDVDFNDDADAIDTFELTIPADSFSDGTLTVEDIEFNGVSAADLELDSVIDEEDAGGTFPDNDIVLSFQETGDNTGIFAAEFEYELLAPASSTVDGDNTEFTWFDTLLESPLESSARLTIGKPDTQLEWQIKEFGLPFTFDPENDSTVEVKRTRVKLFITDPRFNTDSSTVETIPLIPSTAVHGSNPLDTLEIRIEGADGDVLVSADDISTECNGFGSTSFTETGANTGIFDKTFDVFGVAPADTLPGTAFTCGLDPEDLANAKIIAEYDDEEASTVAKGYTGKLTTSSRTINTGMEITVTVTDADQNHDRDVAEQVKVEFEPDGLASTFETLDETGNNTGIFQKKFKVGEDFTILDDGELVDDVTLRYIDAVSSDGSEEEERELKLLPPSSTARIVVTPEGEVGPQTQLTVNILDIDLNDDPNVTNFIETDILEVSSDSKEIIGGKKISTGEQGFELEETDLNTGEFEFTINLVPITSQQKDDGVDFEITANGDEIDIPAEPGDKIAISYEDENHDADGRDFVSLIIFVKSFDPVITTDKPSYSPEDIMAVTIEDTDANKDPDVIDTIDDIDVFSSSDRVGDNFDATETGANTGIFKFEVPLLEEPQEDSVSVSVGDIVTIRYTDQYPADYADRIDDDDNPEKDFDVSVPIGTPIQGTDSTNVTTPTMKDLRGNDLTELDARVQAVISTSIKNNNNLPQQFAAIVEVRDADGFTVYLQWQTGTLQANGSTNIGLSWTPDAPGTYEIRTFAISNLSNPAVLSPVSTSTVTVS